MGEIARTNPPPHVRCDCDDEPHCRDCNEPWPHETGPGRPADRRPTVAEAELDLDAIDTRAQAATPGPWYPWDRGVGWHIATEQHDDDQTPACIPEGNRTDIGHRDDAAFIAAAREDVPALVAEVRRLRGRVAELETALGIAREERDQRRAISNHHQRRADAAEAQVAAVRALHRESGVVTGVCRHCAEPVPCQVGRALDAAGTPDLTQPDKSLTPHTARPPELASKPAVSLQVRPEDASGVATSAPAVTDAMVQAAINAALEAALTAGTSPAGILDPDLGHPAWAPHLVHDQDDSTPDEPTSTSTDSP